MSITIANPPASSGLKQVLKSIARRLAPSLFYHLKRRRRQAKFRRAHGGAEYRATAALVGRHGKIVLSGPFAGMRYGDDAACSAYVAKLVGSYEQELHGVIAEALGRGYRRVIDIGSAEGYYAVGFALKLPEAAIYAFDTDPDAQRYCRDLARLNRVRERVKVGGFCDHETLDRLCGTGSLVICDCEGFERELLDPARIPRLAQTDLLVELHDFLSPGLTQAVLPRFAETHSCRLIDTAERDPEAYEVLQRLDPGDRYWAVCEARPAAMQWAFLKSRSS